jgi:hypothetical protein
MMMRVEVSLDSYLQIAQTVLRSTRRPMSARAILDLAYQAGVVPNHLYGKTQQKTLQARLSEDILHHRETSAFYRTEPGQFALVEFLRDPNFPAEWKKRFPARRRTRDLKRENSLAISRSFIENYGEGMADFHHFFGAADASDAVAYMHPDEMDDRGYCSAWTVSVVLKEDQILAYRVGRYRDDRDAFADKRSICFPGVIAAEDASLFSDDPFGVKDCAISVLVQDLDLSFSNFDSDASSSMLIDCVMVVETERSKFDLIVVLRWNCPDWFEPSTRRLSIKEPHWLCVSRNNNNIEDFEPWSARILDRLSNWKNQEASVDTEYHHSTSCISSLRT